MHISMCQWRGLRSIVAVSFMHRLKTKSSTKGVCPREQDVVRGSISLSARTHGSEKKTKHTHTHDSCMCSGCTDGWHNVFLPLARYDRERERERDEREQRQQALLTGNERVGEVRSHHPTLRLSLTRLLFWRLLAVLLYSLQCHQSITCRIYLVFIFSEGWTAYLLFNTEFRFKSPTDISVSRYTDVCIYLSQPGHQDKHVAVTSHTSRRLCILLTFVQNESYHNNVTCLLPHFHIGRWEGTMMKSRQMHFQSVFQHL